MMKELNLMKAAKGEKVNLFGEEYEAKDLIRCIIDWPCELKWNGEGFRIEEGDYEDWEWFKKEVLVPNTEVIKEIFAKANKLQKKYLKQKEIFDN